MAANHSVTRQHPSSVTAAADSRDPEVTKEFPLFIRLERLIFTSSAIILKDSRQSSASIRRTRSMLSGVVLVGGRPERGSSLTSSFPSLKRLNHSKTHFLLTASTPYTFTNISCVSVAVLPNLKQNVMFTRFSISQ
ncbi:hypothetical protein AVEN_6649-1 [Araneus ventricosus]|uniref:Uncharacterized protein n=1 Tax=Araneus ventricosus TaxID=182803 RepID=A0A4Y2H0J1_ARAVE|nr:hypothetical protein AVEN_6649-1 [Araneus ventricosus]